MKTKDGYPAGWERRAQDPGITREVFEGGKVLFAEEIGQEAIDKMTDADIYRIIGFFFSITKGCYNILLEKQ